MSVSRAPFQAYCDMPQQLDPIVELLQGDCSDSSFKEIVKQSLLSIHEALKGRTEPVKGGLRDAGDVNRVRVRRALKTGFDAVGSPAPVGQASPARSSALSRRVDKLTESTEARLAALEARVGGIELQSGENLARLMTAESRTAEAGAAAASSAQRIELFEGRLAEVERSKNRLLELSVPLATVA